MVLHGCETGGVTSNCCSCVHCGVSWCEDREWSRAGKRGTKASSIASSNELSEAILALDLVLIMALEDTVRPPKDVWSNECICRVKDVCIESCTSDHASTEVCRRERGGAGDKSEGENNSTREL